jgi:hypothetical protein
MKIHELKDDPRTFAATLHGYKHNEIRYNDRNAELSRAHENLNKTAELSGVGLNERLDVT